MIVKKQISNTIIINNVLEAKTLKEKTIGLISKTNKQGLFLKTRFGIHTFGMKHEIDVLVLNNNHRIVKIKHNMGVNKILIWDPKYKLVLELPNGLAKKNNLRVGDKLVIKN